MRQLREPYATLFAGYEDHWLLGQYLWQGEPDWAGLIHEDRFDSLSSGEQYLVKVAFAIWQGDRSATIADLGYVDNQTRRRILAALLLTCDG